MLQQTTVKAVQPFYRRFLQRWPSVRDLAAASLDDVLREWAGLGYYARARNLHACAVAVVAEHGGIFPSIEMELLKLPGIGAYTAAAIAAIAFDQPATPVDGNIERVISRMFAVEEAMPAGKAKVRALAGQLTPERRTGDYVQALMDLGATICTPKKPACILCPWKAPCMAHARGVQETYPRKAPKREGVLRRGAAFWVLREDDHVLLRTRPAEGLLGGMAEVPGTPWTNKFDAEDTIRQARAMFGMENWRKLPGSVRHTFTHFPLELAVYATRASAGMATPPGMRWVACTELDEEALPSLMRKVVAHALKV
jgi:A/G-specific adenine glycosylase